MNSILTNAEKGGVRKYLHHFGNEADTIRIAVAFFGSSDIIEQWNLESKRIDLLVSLRPPTDYYSLEKLQPCSNIKTWYRGKDFHSKIYAFYREGELFAAIVGSSNFTIGGIESNTETNILLSNKSELNCLEIHIAEIWQQATRLESSVLEKYKTVFDNWEKRNDETKKEMASFFEDIRDTRHSKNPNLSPSKFCNEAISHGKFWGIMNTVRDTVKPISKRYFPGIPTYLVLDHFWHWLKTVWLKEQGQGREIVDDNSTRALFEEYCLWDKANKLVTLEFSERSEKIFRRYLSRETIDSLDEQEARIIYKNLNSGGSRAQRFNSDLTFVTKNELNKIRQSLKYLLYDNSPVSTRIHNLLRNPKYSLYEFGPSGIQEILGWVSPEEIPLRNRKADDGVKTLGYKI